MSHITNISIAAVCERCGREALSVLIDTRHTCAECLGEYEVLLHSAHQRYVDLPAINYINDVCPSLLSDYLGMCKVALEVFGSNMFLFKYTEYCSPEFHLLIQVKVTSLGEGGMDIAFDLYQTMLDTFLVRCTDAGFGKVLKLSLVTPEFRTDNGELTDVKEKTQSQKETCTAEKI